MVGVLPVWVWKNRIGCGPKRFVVVMLRDMQEILWSLEHMDL